MMSSSSAASTNLVLVPYATSVPMPTIRQNKGARRIRRMLCTFLPLAESVDGQFVIIPAVSAFVILDANVIITFIIHQESFTPDELLITGPDRYTLSDSNAILAVGKTLIQEDIGVHANRLILELHNDIFIRVGGVITLKVIIID